MEADRTDAPACGEYATIHVVFELSKSKWRLGVMLPGGEKTSNYQIDGAICRLAGTMPVRGSGSTVASSA